MPQNWKSYKLGEVSVDISYGYTESASKEKIGPKFLRITDIQNDFISWDDVPYCKISDKDLVKYQLEIGDVVVARTGNSTGATAVIKQNVNAVYASYLIRYRTDLNICDPMYLDFILRSKKWSDYVDAIKGGSAQPGANAKQFAEFEFTLPPLPEQVAIAQILSSLDDKIELNLQMNKTLEEMAMTLYKHWFVDFEFSPPFQGGVSAGRGGSKSGYKSSGGKFIDSELGPIPEGWEVKRLDEVVSVNSNSIKKNNEPSEINYIDIASVNEGWVAELQPLSYSDAPSRAKRIVSDGDIVWSTVRPNRKSRFLALGMGENTIASTGFAVLTPSKLPYSYIYPYSCTDDFVDYLVSRATGSSYPAVTGKVFEEAKILLPPDEIVNAYDELCQPFFVQYSMNSIENQTLTNLRDTLLPKLISGEVRVKDAEQTIAEAL